MIVISNYVLTDMGIKVPDAISRVNLAWQKDKEAAHSVLSNIENYVFLDYPHGRQKPPRPNMTLDDALELCKTHLNVKYFAISNVEKYQDMKELKARLPEYIELVPKIETKTGILNIEEIIKGAQTETLMLDKEDLYNDVNRDIELFEKCIEIARETSVKNGATLLELRGVVFQ